MGRVALGGVALEGVVEVGAAPGGVAEAGGVMVAGGVAARAARQATLGRGSPRRPAARQTLSLGMLGSVVPCSSAVDDVAREASRRAAMRRREGR